MDRMNGIWSVLVVVLSTVLGCAGTDGAHRVALRYPVQAARVMPSRPGMVFVPAGIYVSGSTEAEVHNYCAMVRANVQNLCAIDPGASQSQEECLRTRAERLCAIVRRELPGTRSHLDAFFIDTTEVTTSDFVAWMNSRSEQTLAYDDHGTFWMGEGDSLLPVLAVAGSEGLRNGVPVPRETYISLDERDMLRASSGADRFPVAQVFWTGADAYCRAHGKRLPTAAEWEAAARGPLGSRFVTGATPETCNVAHVRASYTFEECPAGNIAPQNVGSHPADMSAFGALDMVGGVGEWTSTVCTETRYLNSDQRASTDMHVDYHRVYGGSRRLGIMPAAAWGCVVGTDEATGFRCVANADAPPTP